MQEIELDVTAAADELFITIRFGPRYGHVAADDCGEDVEKSCADGFDEIEISNEIVGVEIVEEYATDAPGFIAVGEEEIFVAPGFVSFIVGNRVGIAGGLEGGVEGF